MENENRDGNVVVFVLFSQCRGFQCSQSLLCWLRYGCLGGSTYSTTTYWTKFKVVFFKNEIAPEKKSRNTYFPKFIIVHICIYNILLSVRYSAFQTMKKLSMSLNPTPPTLTRQTCSSHHQIVFFHSGASLLWIYL